MRKRLISHEISKLIQSENECLTNIGIIYKEIGEYEKALSYLNKSLQIDEQAQERKNIFNRFE